MQESQYIVKKSENIIFLQKKNQGILPRELTYPTCSSDNMRNASTNTKALKTDFYNFNSFINVQLFNTNTKNLRLIKNQPWIKHVSSFNYWNISLSYSLLNIFSFRWCWSGTAGLDLVSSYQVGNVVLSSRVLTLGSLCIHLESSSE